MKNLFILLFLISAYSLFSQTNVALNKPTITDSQLAGYNYTGAKAVDGEKTLNASRWVSDDTSWPHWIEIDLQGTYDINELRFWTGYSNVNEPVQYLFQYWDGVSWITIVDGSGNTTAPVSRVFQSISASKVRLYGTGSSADNIFRLFEIEIYSVPSGTGGAGTISSLWSKEGNNAYYVDGDVGIGTSIPDSKLTVKGKIHAEEVKVDLSVPAPDYVFKKEYDLLTIEEVQQYIKEKGHLPNIPSATEMEQNGVELGMMNMKLLEKIEELTLYTITQEKKLKEQETRLKTLENKLAFLIKK